MRTAALTARTAHGVSGGDQVFGLGGNAEAHHEPEHRARYDELDHRAKVQAEDPAQWFHRERLPMCQHTLKPLWGEGVEEQLVDLHDELTTRRRA